MDEITVLRDAVLDLARIAEGRAVVTEVAERDGPGRHFELRCVDPSDRYARMTIAWNGRDGALYLGSALVLEFDKVSPVEFTDIVRSHAVAVLLGHITEDRTVDSNGQLLACTTTMLLDGEEFVSRYRTLSRRKDARRVTFRYAAYTD